MKQVESEILGPSFIVLRSTTESVLPLHCVALPETIQRRVTTPCWPRIAEGKSRTGHKQEFSYGT